MNENSGSRHGGDPVDSLSRTALCRRFRVTGRVQGVFFRDSTREQAVRMGLTGSARNMPDGSVEVLACGPSDALERLGAWLRSGPPMASVESVEATDVESRSPGKFTIG